MQHVFDGRFHRVVRVTGPTHNLLALELGDDPAAEPVVEELPVSPGERRRLDPGEVLRCVQRGVAEANAVHGTAFGVRTIQYLPSDSPPAEVYREIARRIIAQQHVGVLT